MINNFFAKTNPRETIKEHTLNLIKEEKKLRLLYPDIKFLEWELLNYACMYHDLGKCNCKFQNKIVKNLIRTEQCTGEDYIKDLNLKIDEIPHGYLSCAFLPEDYIFNKFGEDSLKILYQSIYYHHLRNELSMDEEDKLNAVIESDMKRYDKDLMHEMGREYENTYEGLNSDYLCYILLKSQITEEKGDIFYKYIMTKGLLNKLDYAASAHIDVEVKNNDLYKKTDLSLKNNGFEPNDLQRYMIKNKNDNLVIVASTGIGKTEGALYWIGNNKGFFTLPLKVSINAIYDRVREKIKFKDVGLLHSDTYSEYLKRNNNELDVDYYDKTKQLSMPLTICTLDQLIDFVFMYRGFEMKLATLAYSKLVIDEIQMYSADFVGYLLVALYYVNKLGGKFAIVTATLPEIIPHFMKKLDIEFKKPEPFVKKNLNGNTMLRHRLTVINEQINIERILKSYKNKKVLVIVNTVKKAQELYELLKKKNLDVSINMLHSRFIKNHRGEKEKEIYNMGQLECNDTGIWVTTQVVEASLDIDFDILYTELSEVSGLFQRMGRVYRNRELSENSESNVFVYLGDKKATSGIINGDRSVVDIDIFNLSKNAIKSYINTEIDEYQKMRLVSEVYSVDNLKNTRYYKKIWDTIIWTKNIAEYTLEKNQERLRKIDSISIIPNSVYNENRDSIEEIYKQIKLPIGNDANKEQRDIIKNNRFRNINFIRGFTVDISCNVYNNAYREGKVLDYIDISRYQIIPIVNLKYDYDMGIDSRKINRDEKDAFL